MKFAAYLRRRGKVMKSYFITILLLISTNIEANIICLNDPDGDGFAGENAREIDASTASGCRRKGGVVKAQGIKNDCAPNDSSVYMGKSEKPDGKDNNCNGLIDESRIRYSTDLPAQNGPPAVNQILFEVNSSELHERLISSTEDVYYRIVFEPLNGRRKFYHPQNAFAEILDKDKYFPSYRYYHLGKDLRYIGLKRFTVYKITIQFHHSMTTRMFQQTEPFYTITGGNSYSELSKLERFRLKMGLNGLKQYGDFKLGRVGVNGTEDIDGTRYGAKKGETWCDQFWTWLAVEANNGKGFTGINSDNVPRYFRDPLGNGQWAVRDPDVSKRVPGEDNQFFNDGRGKWGGIFFDPFKGNPLNGSLGDMLLGPSHIFMLLSTDKVNKRVYTIDGNIGNKIVIRKLKMFSELPDPDEDDLPSRKKATGIGRLKKFMFTQDS